MKIRLCPKCGKQNDINTWNCVDCGATLSMNTIVESGGQSSQIAIAGKGVLSSVSPFFQDDLTELIKNNTRSSESIIKGCDICQPSALPPFKFGYLIITSHQLLCVCFNSDIKPDLIQGVLPKRTWLRRELGNFTQGGSVKSLIPHLVDHRFVNRPDYGLTPSEKSSREIKSYSLDTLYSSELTNDVFLNIKFRNSDGTLAKFSVAFYFNDEADTIYKFFTEKIETMVR